MLLKECIEILKKDMALSDQEKFKETPKKDLIRYHHTLGRGIRNRFGLWKENGTNELVKDILDRYPNIMELNPELNEETDMNKEEFAYSIYHPDQCSYIVMESFWNYLMGIEEIK